MSTRMLNESLPFESEFGSATGHSETGWALQGDGVLCLIIRHDYKWMRLIFLESFKIVLKASPKNVSEKAEYLHGF